MMILASIIWIPAIRKPFPNQIQARIPLVICLFVFTINPLLGTAIQNACCGIMGTFWACLHMWVMNGIFPGGMKEGMSPTSACAIFGWANFLIFTFVVLICKCGLGTKMFALATDIGFMLAFLDPKSAVPFSENFTISHKGTAVNTLLATAIACVIAPLLNLIPYPFSMASNNMKGNAVKASKDTARLFQAVIAYYNEREYSVVIESELKHSLDLRKELDGLGGAIGAAWFERFDMGVQGTIRALMESHAGLMNNLYDRLRALMIAVSTEDFGPSHIAIMDKIRGSSFDVAHSVKVLLVAATEAATDGDISSSEKAHMEDLVKEAKKAVKQLAVDYDGARRAYPCASKETFGESFFVMTISAYARLVIEYAEVLCTNPPKGVGFGEGISAGISSTFSGLTDRFNVNFTYKHYVALIICWFWSVYIDNWGRGCVITAVFLMSPAVCPDIQAFLNVLNAVILAVVAGTIVFQWTCGTGAGDYVLPIAAFVLWTIGMYGVFAKSVFLLPCLLFVALTPFRWVSSCPTGDIAAGARAIWAGMVANILAMLFVASFQYMLAVDRANHLAVNSLDDAFGGIRKAFDAFWNHADATEPMGSVAGDLGSGSGYAGSAAIEPRFWRNDWKKSLYLDIVGHLQTIRLDVLMLWFAMAGSDGKPDGIFSKFDGSPDFKRVKEDMSGTLEDAHSLAIGMVTHEQGRFTGLSKLKTVTGVDDLDALAPLIKYLNSTLKFPETPPDSLEDDELVQISTVCMLLDCSVKHIAALIKCAIKQA